MWEVVHPVEQARRRAVDEDRIHSLVNTSFTAAGIRWPEKLYQAAWTEWRRKPTYTPTGRGGIAARTALSQEIASQGIPCRPEDLLLTAGSSISYHLLFAVLRRRRNGGTTTVALPTPGYPLFEGILAPLGMEPIWYSCSPENGFLPDHGEIERLVTEATVPPAAVVLISPNNPAGVVYPDGVISKIVNLCAAAGVTVIIDEVFSLFQNTAPTSDLVAHDTSRSSVPVVHLNGLSKLCAAPEVKLGWIMASGGDSAERERLMEALDTEHDTYLSLSGFAEAAVEPFISGGAACDARRGIRDRVTTLRAAMVREIDGCHGLHVMAVDGGIHIPLRLDPLVAAERFGTLDDETIAVELLNRTGVYLHPGYYYGLDYPHFSGGPWFIASALTDDETRMEAFGALRHVL